MIYSLAMDKYYSDPDEAIDDGFNDDLSEEEMLLVICYPIYAGEVDPCEFYCDELPEDVYDLPLELDKAFRNLKKVIFDGNFILSYRPGKFALKLRED